MYLILDRFNQVLLERETFIVTKVQFERQKFSFTVLLTEIPLNSYTKNQH